MNEKDHPSLALPTKSQHQMNRIENYSLKKLKNHLTKSFKDLYTKKKRKCIFPDKMLPFQKLFYNIFN